MPRMACCQGDAPKAGRTNRVGCFKAPYSLVTDSLVTVQQQSDSDSYMCLLNLTAAHTGTLGYPHQPA